MKNLLLVATFFLLTITPTLSQSSFCSSANVVDVLKDTVLDGYLVGIYYEAPLNNFILNPYVQTVINCEGDTIGSGDYFWYMHNGQTTKYYPVTIFTDTICYPATFVFVYETETGVDTCLFTYGEPTNTAEINESDITVYPNPAQDEIRIKSNNITGQDYVIYNSLGMLVLTGKIVSDNTSIDIMGFSQGIYYLGLNKQTIKIIKK